MGLLLTISHVVEGYGLTPYYWKKYADAGLIPHSKDPRSGAYLFDSDDIIAFRSLRFFHLKRNSSATRRTR